MRVFVAGATGAIGRQLVPQHTSWREGFVEVAGRVDDLLREAAAV